MLSFVVKVFVKDSKLCPPIYVLVEECLPTSILKETHRGHFAFLQKEVSLNAINSLIVWE
jgi:hypothetical protein